MPGEDESTDEWPRCAHTFCQMPFKPGTGRGSGGGVCSRRKCREAISGPSKDAKCIAQLELRLQEKDALIASQAKLIELLQERLAQFSPRRAVLASPQQPAAASAAQPEPQQQITARRPAELQQPPAKKPKAAMTTGEDRAPLAQLTNDAQPIASQPAAKEPTGAWFDQVGRLPRGWTKRMSRSRPGKYTYEFSKFAVHLPDPPTFRREGVFCVQRELIAFLLHNYRSEHGLPMREEELWSRIEKCLHILQGSIAKCKSLKRQVQAATQEGGLLALAMHDEWHRQESAEARESQEDAGADSLVGGDEAADYAEAEVGDAIRAATEPAARAERLDVRNLHPDRMNFSQFATLHGMR